MMFRVSYIPGGAGFLPPTVAHPLRIRCAAFFPPSSKAVSPSIRAQLQREDEVQGPNREVVEVSKSPN